MWPRSVSGLQQMLCEKSQMVVGAKVCDLTEDLLWFVFGLYVGILTSSLIWIGVSQDWSYSRNDRASGVWLVDCYNLDSTSSLTGSRGEYFRVVGIHSDGWIDREISIICYPFQNVAATIDQTLLEARNFHFGNESITKLTNQMPLAKSFLLHDRSCDRGIGMCGDQWNCSWYPAV